MRKFGYMIIIFVFIFGGCTPPQPVPVVHKQVYNYSEFDTYDEKESGLTADEIHAIIRANGDPSEFMGPEVGTAPSDSTYSNEYVVSYDKIMDILDSEGNLLDEPTASAPNDDIEIIWDMVTYFVPCNFFKFSISGINKFGETPRILSLGSKNVYYVDMSELGKDELEVEITRFKTYTDNFNQKIYECSKPKIVKGKAKTDKSIKVVEELSITKKTTCYKYKFIFDKSILHTTPSKNFIENYKLGVLVPTDKLVVDKKLEELEEYIKKYNEGKVD